MFHRPRADLEGKSQGDDTVSQAGVRPSVPGQGFTPAVSSGSKGQEIAGNSKKEGQTTMANYQNDETRNETSAPAAAATSQQSPAVGFHRPAAMANAAPRMPASYAPIYPGSASFASQSAAAAATADGRKLVVGEGITLSGEIEACDHLIVEGKVEAALKGARVLDIAETGVFYGTVEIDEATIAGRFEGDLTVGGRLTVRATGSITGAVSYKELAVEAGATIDGKINPVKDRAERKASETSRNRVPESPYAAASKATRANGSYATESSSELFGQKEKDVVAAE